MDKSVKSEPFIVFAPSDRCSGCLICELVCSYFTEGVFNPSKAKLRIARYEEGSRFMIGFLPNCTSCGFCADYCPWDAIVKTRVKKEAK